MKPIHLNLASRPFRDYRPVYATVVVMSIAIAILMLYNIDTYYQYVSGTKTTRARIAQLDADAQREREQAREIESRLRRVNTTALDRETRFINAQLAERAFSWSELLDRLEDVLPNNVRIVSIAPTFNPSGPVHLELQFESKNSQGLLDTLNRLTRDKHFVGPFPHSEQWVSDQSYTFSIGVDYLPAVMRVVTGVKP